MSFKNNLPEYIQKLTESYHAHPVSDGTGNALPDREEIIRILEEIRTLLFPQYSCDSRTEPATENYIIGELMIDIYNRLKKQLMLAFLYERDASTPNECRLWAIEKAAEELAAQERAENVCEQFFEALPKVYDMLATDVQAAFDGDPAAMNKDQIIFSYPGISAITTYRIAHEFYRLNVPLIPRIMTEEAHSKTGIDIHPGAAIGRYFFIDHGTGVVVGETTEIGDRVKVYQGVTLGALSTRDSEELRGKKRHPTIEDDVTIYSGASVLGGRTVIGKGAVIGGAAFITKSVPANTGVNPIMPELQLKGFSDRQ